MCRIIQLNRFSLNPRRFIARMGGLRYGRGIFCYFPSLKHICIYKGVQKVISLIIYCNHRRSPFLTVLAVSFTFSFSAFGQTTHYVVVPEDPLYAAGA